MSDQEGIGSDRPVDQHMGGDVRVWIEQEAIHLVALARPDRDPVELTETMAGELVARLVEFADRLDR